MHDLPPVIDDLSRASRDEIADDIEQILAAEADGVFDLAPATERWLLDALDRCTAPSAAEGG